MMPIDTEFSRPSGLPNANTICPWRSVSESPIGSAGRFFPSTFSTARSVSLSTPIIVASIATPRDLTIDVPLSSAARGTRTWTRRAPSITCELVTMYPLGSRMTPDPPLRRRPSRASALGACSSIAPYPVTTTLTTDGETRRESPSNAVLSASSVSGSAVVRAVWAAAGDAHTAATITMATARALGNRTSATGAGAGGTSEAVRTHRNAPAGEPIGPGLEDRLRRAADHAELDHLVEVAVVQPAIPANRDRVAAHQSLDGCGIE